MSELQPTGAPPVSAPIADPRNATVPDLSTVLHGTPETFEEMGLSPEVRLGLEEMGFATPMPVQRAVVGPMREGKDIMVQSRTGSGKTAAFGIPLVERLGKSTAKAVGALILAPTRELALQSAHECQKIAKHLKLEVVPVYGGAPMGKQIEQLKAGAQIVSGTPGRVLDHLRRGTLKLDDLQVLVLDEADEMLSMGFLEEITEIIKRCPTDRQTVLFSATIPEDIERIGSRYMRSPEKIQLSTGNISVHTIEHVYYMVSGMARTRDLQKVLEVERPESAVIFCNTRDDTNVVAEYLRKQGFDAEAISSDLVQKDRERVMARMKAKDLKYLVATDIAARGIDISDLSHVINYTFPESAEVYVHRTGRTGRAGKSGIAISLVSPRELGNFYMLKLTYRIRPEERPLPSDEQLKTHREGAQVDDLRKLVEGRTVNDESRALARRVITADGGLDLVAALIDDVLHRSRVPHGRAHAAVRREEHVAPMIVPSATPTLAAHVPAPELAAHRPAPLLAEPPAGPADDDAGDPGRRRRRRRPERPERSERSERGERPQREATPRNGTARAAAAAEPRRVEGTIDTSNGREFWEAWVDSRSASPAGDDITQPTPRLDAADLDERPAPEPRPERARRERRPRSGIPAVPEGQARLYLNLGRRDGAEEEQVRAVLAEHGVEPLALDVMSSHSYLNVDEAAAEGAITRLSAARYGERALKCERAKP